MSKDIPHIVDIEKSRAFDPWSESDIKKNVTKPGTVAIVARDRDSDIVGWSVYSAEDKSLLIKRLSVSLWTKRQGVATSMVNYIKARLESGDRFWIRCDVPESQLENGCVFLRECGFVSKLMFSEGQSPSHWNTPEPGVEMIFRKGWE